MAYDDYEQGERVREWIRQNGLSVVIGILAGLLLIFGFRFWQSHQASKGVEAASQYALVDNGVAADKLNQAESMTQSLQDNHAKSTYAVLASMRMAHAYVDNNDDAKAKAMLEKAISLANDDKLKDVARLHLARVLLSLKDYDQAMQTLDNISTDGFQALTSELRGDVNQLQGKTSQAVKNYTKALDIYTKSTPQYDILEMKLNDLPRAESAS